MKPTSTSFRVVTHNNGAKPQQNTFASIWKLPKHCHILKIFWENSPRKKDVWM